MKVKWRNIAFIAGILLVVVLLMDLSRRIERMDNLARQLEAVEAEATAVMQTQEGLMTQVAYATSEAAVKEWAYVDGKWVKAGEHLVEIVPAGEPPSTTDPTPTTISTEMPKWRIWWELFFGDQP